MGCSVWEVLARTVILYRGLDVTREENGRLFHLFNSFRNAAGIVCAGEIVTVCDVKSSGGTLGDSGLVRAWAAQKYFARGGL